MQPVQSILYSVPYIIIVFAMMFLSIHEKNVKTNKIAIFVMGAILVLFFGLRGFVHTDWALYYWLYLKTPSLVDIPFYQEPNIEPGFNLYMQIFKTLNVDYHAWVFISTLIDIIALTFIFKRYSLSVGWSWVFFFCFSGIGAEISLMRNIKAIIIFLFSLRYIYSREFWKFFLLWLFAMTFHSSAALYFPAYFVLTKNWGKLWPAILFVAVNFIFLFKAYPTTWILNHISGIDSAFIDKAVAYTKMVKAEGITFGYIERTVMFILVYFLYDRLRSQNGANVMFCNSFYIFYMLWYIFSDVPVFVERMPVLFVYSYWILGPNMIRLAAGTLRRVINVVVILFVMMKVITVTDHILYDYDNLLTGIRTKESRLWDKDRYENSQR